VRVHDATTGEEKEVYKGHHGPVHAISYVSRSVLQILNPLNVLTLRLISHRMVSFMHQARKTAQSGYGKQRLKRMVYGSMMVMLPL
jgi:hypothetical protein